MSASYRCPFSVLHWESIPSKHSMLFLRLWKIWSSRSHPYLDWNSACYWKHVWNVCVCVIAVHDGRCYSCEKWAWLDGSFVLLCRAKPRPTTKAVNMPRSSNHRSPRKISRKVQPPRTAALRQSPPPPPPLPPALQSLPAALTNQVNSSFCTCSTSPVPSSFSYPSLSMCVYFYTFLPAALTPNPRRCLHSMCLCVLHVVVP